MKTYSSPAASISGAEVFRSLPTDLNVFFAYDSFGAALRASESLAALTRQVTDGLTLKLSPWSFACLANPIWRRQSMQPLECAHLIVITSCSRALTLPVVIEDWLRSCLEHRHEGSLTVAALFYDGDWPDEPFSPRLQSLQRLVQEAGCAFFAPGIIEDQPAGNRP